MAKAGRPSVAAESRDRTRARLLEAGRELFSARGVHRVTSHDIADEAGVATGTFYNHFKDKHVLFRAVAESAIGEMMQLIDSLAGGFDEREAGVQRQVEALADFGLENRSLLLLLFGHGHSAGSVEADLMGALASTIAEDRRQTIQAGKMPAEIDPDIYAQALVGMWARVLTWWAEDPSRASRDELVETLSRIELSGTHPKL